MIEIITRVGPTLQWQHPRGYVSPWVYFCQVTGKTVTPVGYGPVTKVNGRFFRWWSCSACDQFGNRRGECGYDDALPGPHVAIVEVGE